MATDYETLKEMLARADIDFKDAEAGVPRRHFLEIGQVVIRFEPDGSLNEVYALDADQTSNR